MKQLLFVSGVARSGTSALVRLLNTHPNILISHERFLHEIRQGALRRAHFEKGKFIKPPADGSKPRFPFKMDELSQRYDEATIIGDKFPALFRHFGFIFERFPDARHLYIARDPLSVAESFQARHDDTGDNWAKNAEQGVREWNQSIRTVVRLPEEQRRSFHVVLYEDLFSSPDAVNAMFAALGLPPADPQSVEPVLARARQLDNKPVVRQGRLRRHVALTADRLAYRQLVDMAHDRAAPPP